MTCSNHGSILYGMEDKRLSDKIEIHCVLRQYNTVRLLANGNSGVFLVLSKVLQAALRGTSSAPSAAKGEDK